jgi:hypothetical protein
MAAIDLTICLHICNQRRCTQKGTLKRSCLLKIALQSRNDGQDLKESDAADDERGQRQPANDMTEIEAAADKHGQQQVAPLSQSSLRYLSSNQ